ncbi:MAG: hypothetical protein ACK4UJ_05745 [Leptonema sp. (in: bacteria)]
MLKAILFLYKSLISLEAYNFHNSFGETTLNKKKCYVFVPEKKWKGIIVVIHGMTVKGIEDKRLWKQCEILRQMNYKVYLPHYPEIQNLKINKESIHKIKKDILEIYKENQKPIKILSVSFSGGLSIVASSKKEIRNKVDSLLIIGTYANIKTIFEFFIKEENIDPYGYFILLKNFLEIIPEYKNQKLKKVFELAAKDNALSTNFLEAYLSKNPDLKKIFQKLSCDKRFKIKILKRILNSPVIKDLGNSLDVLPVVKNLNSRIALIHGKYDKVIPPNESILIIQECKKYNIPTQICLTSILDHGNVQFNLGLVKEFIRLIQTLDFFLK